MLDEVEAMEHQDDDDDDSDQEMITEAERMESDEELLAEVERIKTQEGGALADERGHFRFDLVPFRQRQARSYGLERTSYHLRVRNPVDTRPTGHRNIVRAFEQGLADALDSLIRDLPDHDRIQIYLGSNRLRSAHTSAHVAVGGWRDPLAGSRQILHQISKLLNSNENFEVDDTLELDVTNISMPIPSSGPRRRWCFGSDHYRELLKNKRSVIRIKNQDDLCCAMALFVAKTRVDADPNYGELKYGSPIQKRCAKELHEQGGVPPGPCGLKEIRLFEIFLIGYQIIVISAEHGHAIVHQGPDSDKELILLMHDGHFDVITKLPGFFSQDYFCKKCQKGSLTSPLLRSKMFLLPSERLS